MVGEVIGSYRITERIGQGGMGTVYLAEHLLIGRKAALKVLVPDLSHNESVVNRFFNEARATTAVRHPGIVEIYDFGHHTDGSAYLVMEYLQGESLEARIRRLGTMSAVQSLPIVRHVASALAAAHDQEIVHRDLKPDNLFIVSDPEVAGGERIKVLDFGIAKLAGDAKIGAFKTRTGAVLGTPSYMSPEQCKGAGGVDHRTDLYALGCILFRLLCGRPPFVAAGGGEVLAQHIYAEPPAPRSLVPSIPDDVEALVLRLLAKEPAHRPASAREISAAVDALLASHGASNSRHATNPRSATDGGSEGPMGHRDASSVRQTTLRTGAGAVAELPPPPRTTGRGGIILGTSVTGLAIIGVVLALVQGSDPAGEAGTGVVAVRSGESELTSVASGGLVEREGEPRMDGFPDAPHHEEESMSAPHIGVAPDAASAAADDLHEVVIESTPSGAAVYRDGQRLGETPYVVRVDAMPGETIVVLAHPGHQKATVTLPAAAGEEERVHVVLDRIELRKEVVKPRRPQPARKNAAAQEERRKPQPSHRQEALEQGAPLEW